MTVRHLAVLAAGLTLAAGTVFPRHAALAAAVDLKVDGGRLSLHSSEPASVADLVRSIAAAIGAQVTLRRDPGTVGPLTLRQTPVADALRLLAGRGSLALRYGPDGVISAIVLVATGGTPAVVQPVPATPPEPAPPPPTADRQSVALRDVVELSYREDEAARIELARLAGAAEDPAVRGAAISALANTNDALAFRAIDSVGLTDRDPTVRLQAARGLQRLQGANARPRLAAAAAIEPDAGVRQAIAALLNGGR